MARAPTARAGFPIPKPLAFVTVPLPCAQLNTKSFVLSTKIFVLLCRFQRFSFSSPSATSPPYLVAFSLDTTAHSRHNPRHRIYPIAIFLRKLPGAFFASTFGRQGELRSLF